MKKVLLTILVSFGIICSVGFCFKIFNLQWPFAAKENGVAVLENLPFGIERNNPIPEVRHWDLEQKTFYYFNWGLKTTGGYSLELLGVENNLLKIKAKVPKKGQMLIQALTFPYLLISLPRANYRYEVVNEEDKPIRDDIFIPKNPPLKMMIFLPRDNHVSKREVLRDPYLNSKGKSPVLIVLEALFNQEEMLDYVSRGVLPEKAVFSNSEQKWYILLSKSYEQLSSDEKKLLNELINKTVLTLTANNLQTLEIVTDPNVLPVLKN